MRTSSEDFTVKSCMYHATFCIKYEDSGSPEKNLGTTLFIHMIRIMPTNVLFHYSA